MIATLFLKIAMENILSEYGDEGLNISLFIKDCSISNWLPSEHFSKIYYDEIKYIKEQYYMAEYEETLQSSIPGKMKNSLKAAEDFLLAEIEK